ncbi:hypothetical protein, partial [Nonomuraea sp. NPDC005501]|uniref:hypothetical protein n=1 Tax=Nonomuraea sp. NPDC005501 TaxID=3156884 RepID=UPI0033AD5F49
VRGTYGTFPQDAPVSRAGVVPGTLRSAPAWAWGGHVEGVAEGGQLGFEATEVVETVQAVVIVRTVVIVVIVVGLTRAHRPPPP